jgi:hypothetical protein
VVKSDSLLVVRTLFAVLTVLLLAGGATAYVGPETGVEFIGYFMTLVSWAAVALGGVLLWPVHALLRRLRGSNSGASDQQAQEDVPLGAAEK